MEEIKPTTPHNDHVWLEFSFLSYCKVKKSYQVHQLPFSFGNWGRRGSDRMLVGFTTTYAIHANYHYSWPTPRNWQWGTVKNETLRQNRWFQFSHCELSIHIYIATFQQHLHMEYISQLIRYSKACGSYQDFLDRGFLLTRKLLNQGFLLVKLKSSLRKFYSCHHDLVDCVSQITMDIFRLL